MAMSAPAQKNLSPAAVSASPSEDRREDERDGQRPKRENADCLNATGVPDGPTDLSEVPVHRDEVAAVDRDAVECVTTDGEGERNERREVDDRQDREHLHHAPEPGLCTWSSGVPLCRHSAPLYLK